MIVLSAIGGGLVLAGLVLDENSPSGSAREAVGRVLVAVGMGAGFTAALWSLG